MNRTTQDAKVVSRLILTRSSWEMWGLSEEDAMPNGLYEGLNESS